MSGRGELELCILLVELLLPLSIRLTVLSNNTSRIDILLDLVFCLDIPLDLSKTLRSDDAALSLPVLCSLSILLVFVLLLLLFVMKSETDDLLFLLSDLVLPPLVGPAPSMIFLDLEASEFL